VRKVELVLIKNFHEKKKDEHTVRIRAHAQRKFWKGDRIVYEDSDVDYWEEYWVFGRKGDVWKLKEMLVDGQGETLGDQENFDKDTSQQMLDWFYSKDRASWGWPTNKVELSIRVEGAAGNGAGRQHTVNHNMTCMTSNIERRGTP